MRDFHGLVVWEKSHALTIEVCRLATRFPVDERFGLISQLWRSAASIPANLAGGCGRGGEREFVRFDQIAMGSASEVEYHVLLAKDLNCLGENDFTKVTSSIHEVKRMLTSLMRTARQHVKMRKTDD